MDSIFYCNRNVRKSFTLNFLLALFLTGSSLFGFGQSVGSTAQDSTVSVQKQYVKIEIGMHILDCPVLPKELKRKLMTVKGIQDYKEDAFSQSVYFNIPEGAISKEQIVNVALGCAFPAQSINVLMAAKPFIN